MHVKGCERSCYGLFGSTDNEPRFKCAGCNRTCAPCMGASDDMPSHCTTCWMLTSADVRGERGA